MSPCTQALIQARSEYNSNKGVNSPVKLIHQMRGMDFMDSTKIDSRTSENLAGLDVLSKV